MSGLIYSIRGLAKIYGEGESAVHALRGVDLDLPEGKTAALLGPSGSGKSTLLNIVGGLDKPSAGSVLFRGREITSLNDRETTRYRRENIGFIFQFYNLVPSLTARENVALAAEISDAPMSPDDALAMVGLAGRGEHFPAQLSGGEQQRVAVARAIVKRPRALLCDEPTGALDSKTGVVVLEALEKVASELGAATALITHNAEIARMADAVVYFADGAIVRVADNPQKIAARELTW
jgi:putative ABC transport system ATP-binding protein